ncbi:MAG: uroporphyrinogen-III synthase [Dehalococcoidia bacterium]|nr:uroporphyrinogen-III synthase [Dehalococcoidia bacterium]
MGILEGKVIAVLEARRAGDMVSLITRHGGIPYSAPALKEVPLDNSGEVASFIDQFVDGRVSLVIFLTGVGTRALLGAAAGNGRLEEVLAALDRMTVVARGPKPVAVLKEYKVRIDMVPPEPNTSQELLEMLRPLELRGKTVAMQHYGQPNVFLRDALVELGAAVLEVSLYRWDMPDDAEPLAHFLDDVQKQTIHVVAATSQAQVHNLFRLAESFGKQEALQNVLNKSVAVAAVGPVCARAWEELGVTVDIMPVHPKMGHLVLAIADYLHKNDDKGAAGAAARGSRSAGPRT